MKKMIRNFERFCIRHKNKGIPNLMFYIAIASAVVYLISMVDPSATVFNLLRYDYAKILQGQVWRLLTFVITPMPSGGLFGGLFTFLMLFFYYRIGQLLEQSMGTLKFNLFYFTGVILLDVTGLLCHVSLSVDSLNMSLILAFATLFSEAQVLLMYVIPIKMKYLAWFYLFMTAMECFSYRTLLPLLPLVSYLLFFATDFYSLLPVTWRVRRTRKVQRTAPKKAGPNWADGYQSKSGQKPYHHKCTVCGRTDTEFPDLEFRYCSRCNGYYCYCMDHINQHEHVK